MSKTLNELQAERTPQQDPLIERIVVKICIGILMGLGYAMLAASALAAFYLMVIAPLVVVHLSMLALQGVEHSTWMGVPTLGIDYLKFCACAVAGLLGWALALSVMRGEHGRYVHYADRFE